jgi:hypothetical protein
MGFKEFINDLFYLANQLFCPGIGRFGTEFFGSAISENRARKNWLHPPTLIICVSLSSSKPVS